MIFTSYTYVVFLTLAFLFYWFLPQVYKKPLLIALSYIFYCYWQWQFGFLLLGLSLFNWFYTKRFLLNNSRGKMLASGIIINLLPLLYFKYAGFFLENVYVLSKLGRFSWNPVSLSIILPLGISFSTFQNISYLVDVSAGEKPFSKLQDFLLYKAFWPQLLAGPIIRPGEIREQIEAQHYLKYDDLSYGSKRILEGLFKKMVIADTLAPFVNTVFISNITPGMTDSIVGILAFGLQIYFDFSGYSDIAIGSARLFGFVFPENFYMPYFSCSPQEFWGRWHITLSRWIRDYIFTPLAFKTRKQPIFTNLWLIVAMAICGLWHGAQWTFVLWGVWHGMLLVFNQTVLKGLFSGLANNLRSRLSLRGIIAVTAGWLLFRAKDFRQISSMLKSIVTLRNGFRPAVLRESEILIILSVFILLMLYYFFQTLQSNFRIDLKIAAWKPVLRFAKPLVYIFIITAIIIFDKQAKTFVYFQF
jgi:alginate O-acetyltransferase complex protein AlgI